MSYVAGCCDCVVDCVNAGSGCQPSQSGEDTYQQVNSCLTTSAASVDTFSDAACTQVVSSGTAVDLSSGCRAAGSGVWAKEVCSTGVLRAASDDGFSTAAIVGVVFAVLVLSCLVIGNAVLLLQRPSSVTPYETNTLMTASPATVLTSLRSSVKHVASSDCPLARATTGTTKTSVDSQQSAGCALPATALTVDVI